MSAERPLRADARRNRERILTTATDAFATDGVAVSLDEIARRAGVGPGTVHRHFPAKEDLYEAVVVEHLTALRRDAEEALRTDPTGASLFTYLSGLVERTGSKQDVAEAVAAAGTEAGPASVRAAAELRAVFGELFARAREAGLVRADLTVEDVQAVVMGALAAKRYLDGGGARVVELLLGCVRA